LSDRSPFGFPRRLWCPPPIPEKYIISRGPAEFGRPKTVAEPASPQLEKPQVLDGSTYNVITPIFTGQDGNNSFLRFPNYEATIGTNLVTVVGATSGTVYGTATVAPQPHASIQLPIATILTLAGVNATTNPTSERVTLYVRNPALTAAYQHVIFNGTSGFFENMSACTYVNAKNYRYLNTAVFNVHTTALADYPSFVTVHNFLNTPVTMIMDVYEAATGDLKGTYTASTLANTTYAIPFVTIQNEAGWSPTSAELHGNLIVRTPNNTSAALAVGQYIYNATLKTYVNMTTVCPINYGNQ
jgi:hypothetical protein